MKYQKTLQNTEANGATKNVPDIKFCGNGDTFKLISKASSQIEGWMKSTKALDTGVGCIIQVTTQQTNPDGSYSIAEALTFAPGTRVTELEDTEGNVIDRAIVPIVGEI